jgi:serpin B
LILKLQLYRVNGPSGQKRDKSRATVGVTESLVKRPFGLDSLPFRPPPTIEGNIAMWKSLTACWIAAGAFLVGAQIRAQDLGSYLDPPVARADPSPDVLQLVNGNNQFAVGIYSQIAANANNGDNLLVSPFSISAALTMTYAGAGGNTARQMASVLGFSLPPDRLHAAFGQLIGDLTAPNEPYQLSIANRLFGQAGFQFQQPFLDITSNDYGAPLEQLDFIHNADGARNTINQWVEQQTNNKIQNLLPSGSVTRDTRLVLTNAIYFNGKWASQFDKQMTAPQAFYRSNNTTVQVPTMHQSGLYRYASMAGFQMLEMPYAGNDVSMVVMLPTNGNGLANLESSFTPQLWSSSLAALHLALVDLAFPKFTFDSSFKLASVLEAMGMTDAFSGSADFTKIGNGGLALSDVIHKAFIDVNEEGTEAAAATGVTIVATSAYEPPLTPIIFDVDHPFMFGLEDNRTGSLLFLGRVADPSTLTAVPEPATATMLLAGLAIVAFKRRNVGATGSASVGSQTSLDISSDPEHWQSQWHPKSNKTSLHIRRGRAVF